MTNKQTTFTPGTWTATESDPAEGAHVFWISALLERNFEKDICSVPGPDAANARLIAAAPDLYAACVALLQFNEELCADVNVSKHYPSAEKARRAIAKADEDLSIGRPVPAHGSGPDNQ